MVRRAVVMVHQVPKVLQVPKVHQAQSQMSVTLATVQTVHQMRIKQPVCYEQNTVFNLKIEFHFKFAISDDESKNQKDTSSSSSLVRVNIIKMYTWSGILKLTSF